MDTLCENMLQTMGSLTNSSILLLSVLGKKSSNTLYCEIKSHTEHARGRSTKVYKGGLSRIVAYKNSIA